MVTAPRWLPPWGQDGHPPPLTPMGQPQGGRPQWAPPSCPSPPPPQQNGGPHAAPWGPPSCSRASRPIRGGFIGCETPRIRPKRPQNHPKRPQSPARGGRGRPRPPPRSPRPRRRRRASRGRSPPRPRPTASPAWGRGGEGGKGAWPGSATPLRGLAPPPRGFGPAHLSMPMEDITAWQRCSSSHSWAATP